MSEASSGEIQACASQVKIEEIDEASTNDGRFFMTEVEVKGEVTTSSDWRYYIQQVVIEESGKASVSDCQAYESHTKFENTMETSSNDRCYYMQHVIEEYEEAAASDPLSNVNPVKIEEGMEAFSHGGQQDMETEGVEEASPNDHHTSMTHIKLEAEEAAFSSFQYHIELAGMEEGEKASASDREVCLGLVKTEDVSATDSQDLVRQVMAKERDEAPAVDQAACLWHIKVEDEEACAIDKQACMTHIKIEEEDVSIDEQACMRHIKIEDEAGAIGQQACMRPPMFGKDEAHANEEQTCVRRLKIEEQMHAPDQQASVSQVKTEGGDECPIGQEMCMDEVKTKEEYEAISGTKWQNVIDHRLIKEGEETPTNYTLQFPTNPVMSDEGQQTSAQDIMGLAESAEMEVEEGTSSVYYQNAIVQLMPGKEGETMAKNGHYLLVTLAITGGSATSAREQQNSLTQVEMQREDSFVGELKGFVGRSNIDNKADTLTKGLQVPREFAQEENPRGSSIKDSVRSMKGEQREEGPSKDTHDPSDPCKIQEKQDPPCMVFHHPMRPEVADEEQHTPWHLDEYTVYMDVEEGKEQLVFHDPLVQEGHMLSASPYNRSTVQEYQLPLSDDHDPTSHEDDDVSSSNEQDLQFQDGEELSDWEYLDWRNFVSNDTQGDLQATAGENTTNQQSQSPSPERELSDADSLCFSDEEHQPGPSGLPGRTPIQGLIVPTNTTTTTNTAATTTLTLAYNDLCSRHLHHHHCCLQHCPRLSGYQHHHTS